MARHLEVLTRELSVNVIDFVLTNHKHRATDATDVDRAIEFAAELALLSLMPTLVFVRDRILGTVVFGVAGALILFEATRNYVSKREGRREDSGALRSQRKRTDNPDARLVCYGEQTELRSLENLTTELTEPAVFKGTGGGTMLKMSSYSRLGAPRIIGLLAVLLIVSCYAASDPVLLFAGLVFANWGVDALYAQWKGLYYRVVPGRLDLLRFGPLRSKGTAQSSVSLRAARIVCRYDKQELRISPLTEITEMEVVQEDHAIIDLARLRNPHAFVKAVFQAAICTANCPRLTAHELVG
jgi:hypothetical protein